MAETTEDDDRAVDEPGRDGWVAVLLIVVIALVAFGHYHGIPFVRW
jgi:hypothetical protein